MADIEKWLKTTWGEGFTYDPEQSDTLGIYQRQAQYVGDEERRRMAKLMASRGATDTGAVGRGSMRIAQGQERQMAQNLAGDVEQQYGRFASEKERAFKGKMMEYQMLEADYDNAMQKYYADKAEETQKSIRRMQEKAKETNWGQVILGGAMAVGGIAASPFTGGASLGLVYPGIGIASGGF